jgi:hypothetical protein
VALIPHIRQADGQIGFYWVTPAGQPVTLPDLMTADTEPLRLLPTHLSALDDALIDAAGRWGEVLGGGRPVRDDPEAVELTGLSGALERLNHEYAVAERAAGLTTELRAGQIIGTSALLAIRARMALGGEGPLPFGGMLAEPRPGVMAGHGQFHWVDPDLPWRGGRWLLVGQDGQRYPLTLDMILHGSGVEKDGALDEHRTALRTLSGLAAPLTAPHQADGADPGVLAGSLEWLLYDWLMAHRESERSAAIEIRSGRPADAAMIVTAALALAEARTMSADHRGSQKLVDAVDVAVVEVLQAGGEPFALAVQQREVQEAGEVVEVLPRTWQLYLCLRWL